MGVNVRDARLVVGANHLDRVIEKIDTLLFEYRTDIGHEYIKYRPCTPSDKLLPEDLAVTLLVNSNAGYRAFQSLRDQGATIDLSTIPNKSLEQVDEVELERLASLIANVANWKGFGASLATKVLHKKRPALIPVLDNQAIFGAYMNPNWPQKRSSQDSVKSQVQILQALRWIKYDLLRSENQEIWPVLQDVEPMYSFIELFDSVWWMHFRKTEPVMKGIGARGRR